MLVLSRKEGEVVRIGPDIVLTVVRLGRGRVQLGIDAPPHVRIRRDEILAALSLPSVGCGSDFHAPGTAEQDIEHCAAG